ncbi:putative protein kinase UbiB [Planctomycetes bacterium Poly30]|uniref:ABC1 atypical kinase-like domain-containing protein n=1 Tax=Saltatorellus ferox TaxID=2528018 RepID=A0A518EL30_9BACT|nr:putative protein kinase UbiB [Planctomycetes bacterium Poly30]
MLLTSLPQFRRGGTRFVEIVATLVRYGLADRLERIEPGFLKRWLHHEDVAELASMSPGKRARLACEELGPTFIKVAQILSTRPDVISPDIAEELALLRSGTPPDAFEDIQALIESELDAPLGQLFSSFDPVPLASASIGQVHAARLFDGREVIVKVQHPGIAARVEVDFDVIESLAHLLDQYDEGLRSYQLGVVAEEVRRTLRAELDFRRERRSLERFRRAFADDPSVTIPATFPELCSERVLTMEYVKGYSIGEKERLVEDGHDRTRLAVDGARVFLDMIFVEGAFHADPHPGNVLVQPDGRIALVDFGMVGFLDQGLRDHLIDLLLAFVHESQDDLERAIDAIATLPSTVDRQRLRRDMAELQAEVAGIPIEEISTTVVLGDFTALLRRHRILLPATISMLIKVLVMLEGTARSLDRRVSMMEILRPYGEDIIRQRASPRARLRQTISTTRDWIRLGERLPRLLDHVSRRFEHGQLRLDLVHSGLEATVNRLVSGILCAAMLLGGSVLWALKAPPVVLGVPVVGVTATFLALAHGLRLLYQLRNHK